MDKAVELLHMKANTKHNKTDDTVFYNRYVYLKLYF